MKEVIAKDLLSVLNAGLPKLGLIIGWVVVAAWIETEGNISSYITRSRVRRDGARSPSVSRRICIMQKDPFPLKVSSRFLCSQGIPSKVAHMNPSSTAFSRTPYYRLNITGLRDLDAVITRCNPFFITKKARVQVGRYWRYRHTTTDELRLELTKRYGETQNIAILHSP